MVWRPWLVEQWQEPGRRGGAKGIPVFTKGLTKNLLFCRDPTGIENCGGHEQDHRAEKGLKIKQATSKKQEIGQIDGMPHQLVPATRDAAK